MGNITWRSRGSSEDTDSVRGDLGEDTGTDSPTLLLEHGTGSCCVGALKGHFSAESPLIFSRVIQKQTFAFIKALKKMFPVFFFELQIILV